VSVAAAKGRPIGKTHLSDIMPAPDRNRGVSHNLDDSLTLVRDLHHRGCQRRALSALSELVTQLEERRDASLEVVLELIWLRKRILRAMRE
jgi:hypothetical protein